MFSERVLDDYEDKDYEDDDANVFQKVTEIRNDDLTFTAPVLILYFHFS